MDVIDFANGQPAAHELPNELIRDAMQDVFSSTASDEQSSPKRQRVTPEELSADLQSSAPLSYGDYNLRFRSELSKFLGRCDASRDGVAPDPSHLMPSAGVSQALDMICTMCASAAKKDIVLVETPTYFLASAIFRDHGLEVRGVETDSNGIIPEKLSAALEAIRAEGRRAAMLYVIPVHHNPTGRTMSGQRRSAIVELTRVHGTLIVADEVYTLLTYGSASPPVTLSALGSHVLSIASFSKVLAPGLRVGWIEGDPEQLACLSKWGVIDSGGHLSHFSSCIVASALEMKLVDSHLAHLRALYASRCSALLHALREHLPDCSILDKPQGGYFVWLQLPIGISAASLVQSSTVHGVRIKEGGAFSPAEGAGVFDNYVRLCFARLTETDLLEGVKRLCAAIKKAR